MDEQAGEARVDEPDPQTVRAAAAGDLEAFEGLVRAYQGPVWRFLCHLLSDPALAEDCTQETFLRVHRRLRSFRYRSKFSTWVYTIARNAGIDALRARERRDRLAEQAADVARAAPAKDPSRDVEVTHAVASLPHKLREAFVLVEVVGLTYRQAGEAASAPEGTMKSRVFRARGLLLEWLADDEAAEGGRADEV